MEHTFLHLDKDKTEMLLSRSSPVTGNKFSSEFHDNGRDVIQGRRISLIRFVAINGCDVEISLCIVSEVVVIVVLSSRVSQSQLISVEPQQRKKANCCYCVQYSSAQ